jgi:hypothetical protein
MGCAPPRVTLALLVTSVFVVIPTWMVCVDCGHDWSAEVASASVPDEDAGEGVRDANGAQICVDIQSLLS